MQYLKLLFVYVEKNRNIQHFFEHLFKKIVKSVHNYGMR